MNSELICEPDATYYLETDMRYINADYIFIIIAIYEGGIDVNYWARPGEWLQQASHLQIQAGCMDAHRHKHEATLIDKL